MIQNIIIVLILVACALFIGRRFYNNLKRNQPACGCGCSCSDCGPDIVANCKPSDTESDQK